MADISSITLPGGGTYDLKDKNAQRKITVNGVLKGNGQGGISVASAEDVSYTGIDSRMSSTNVQDALDELVLEKADVSDLPFPSGPDDFPLMDGTAAVGSMDEYARADHVHPSDTTKANQTQIAVVETGTTASVNHSVGEYFCWNGLLHRATAAIFVGQSFTPGANCYQTTAMDMTPPILSGGDLNDYKIPGLYTWTNTAANFPANIPANGQGVMIVLQASNVNRVVQIVLAHTDRVNGIYYRWFYDTAWTTWYTIG